MGSDTKFVETKKVNITNPVHPLIDEYERYASKRSPLTPPHFHQNIFLTLIAGLIARRVHLQLPHEKLYPNLYTLVIATTSVHAKTTAFNIARGVTDSVMPERVIDSISTPEAMEAELAGEQPSNLSKLSDDSKDRWQAGANWGARRLFFMDEAGRFLNSMRRDYNEGMDALMMKLYDSSDTPIKRQTIRAGINHIEKPSLTCLFATTPSNIRAMLSGSDAWTSGFWNRWNFVSQLESLPWSEGQFINLPKNIPQTMKRIDEALNEKDLSAILGKKVSEQYYDFTRRTREAIISEDDERVHGILSRLPTKRIKSALCLAIIDNPKKPEVKIQHWDAIEYLCVRWHQDALAAIERSERTDRVSVEEKIFNAIQSYNKEGITARYLQQLTRKTSKEVNEILEEWRKAGTVYKKESGRKTLWHVNEV